MRRIVVAFIICVVAFVLYPRPGAAAVEGIECEAEPTDMDLQYGNFLEGESCTISVGDTDTFRFVGSIGEKIIVQASRQAGGTPCIELLEPDGIPIGSMECSFSGARMDAKLTKPGTHTIVVSEQFNDQTMDYGLVLDRVAPPSPPAAPLCFGCNLVDEINGIGDTDLYIFNAESGDTVAVLASRQSGGTPCVELFGPDGLYTPKGNQVCSFSGAQIDEVIAQNGVHTIVVSEQFNDQTMPYSVDLQCTGGCPDFPAAAEVLLSEDFNTDGLANQRIWRLPFGGEGAFLGRTELKTDLTSDYPRASDGVVTLELDTFRDDGMGNSTGLFHGASLHTKRNFVVGGGLRFEVRARVVDSIPGLDAGLFLFDVQRHNAMGDLVRDEIDHELLTNDTSRVLTNVWNDGSFEGPDAGGDAQFLSPGPGFDITDFHNYRIDWLPNRIDWFVDGNLIRTKTTDIPDDPMNFQMNLWVPDETFVEAYDANLQPAKTPAENQTFRMEIDNVEITQLNTTRSDNLILDSSFEDPSFPYFNLSAGDMPDQSATGQWVAFNNQDFSTEVAHSGVRSVAMFGPFSGGPDASGIFQNVDASPGDVFEASVFTQTMTGNSIKGATNYTTIKIEFLDTNGNVLPGLAPFLGENGKENIIIEGRDPDIPQDEWVQRHVNAVAPSGTTRARVTLLFVQLKNGGGTAWFDDLTLVRLSPNAVLIDGDFNDDAFYNVPRKLDRQ